MTIDRKKAIPDSTLLVDWVSSVYGVFWGVWLGFFVEQLGKNLLVEYIPTNLSPVFICGFAILLILFIFNYIKWLWFMRHIGENSRGREIFGGFKRISLFIVMVFGIYVFGYLYTIDIMWRNMGAWATIGWPLVIIAVTISDKRGWIK